MIQRTFIKDGHYQVYNRGNHRKDTFLSDCDYRTFLNLARKFSDKYKIKIIVYCLISNHFHFVLKQSSERSMSKFMHGLGTSYSMYFNSKYKTVGHVFQGPYRATYIDNEESLLNEINYVLRNPEKHGIVSDSSLYKWVGWWKKRPGLNLDLDPVVSNVSKEFFF